MEIQTVMKKTRREEDLPLQFSSTELLVIFISFYWLIFNTIYFILLFIFASSFILFALFILFCHGDGYKHTPKLN